VAGLILLHYIHKRGKGLQKRSLRVGTHTVNTTHSGLAGYHHVGLGMAELGSIRNCMTGELTCSHVHVENFKLSASLI
jgi:hypothetical protein